MHPADVALALAKQYAAGQLTDDEFVHAVWDAMNSNGWQVDLTEEGWLGT